MFELWQHVAKNKKNEDSNIDENDEDMKKRWNWNNDKRKLELADLSIHQRLKK